MYVYPWTTIFGVGVWVDGSRILLLLLLNQYFDGTIQIIIILLQYRTIQCTIGKSHVVQ